ncbi:hypothetical protein NUSPORA_01483 [Nucleospora cyclopteri]
MSELEIFTAETCINVINDPENKIEELKELIKMAEEDKTILSIAKTFSSICPLYKIRVHKEKIKHKNADNEISKYDKLLVEIYGDFLKKILPKTDKNSFLTAVYLLENLDHFNFNDRLVAKVVLGTKKEETRDFCIEALVSRIKEDSCGEILHLILDKCLDFDFSYKCVEALLDSNYLEICLSIRIEKEEKYEKKQKLEFKKDPLKKDNFFNKNRKLRGKDKKTEKKRLQLQNEVRKTENEELGEIDNKTYVKTVKSLQRLYFTVLKQQKKNCLISTIKGVEKYFRIIQKEFHEGLMTLLLDNLVSVENKNYCFEVNIQIIKTIHSIFSGSGIDFNKPVSIFYQMIGLMKLTNIHAELLENGIKNTIELLFIKNKQQPEIATAFVQRLMQLKMMKYVPIIDKAIKDIEVKYNLDFKEKFQKRNCDFNPDKLEISNRTTYEYFLYKKFL